MNSRSKGARGEREFAAFLKELGVMARRGAQYKGGDESPDVVSTIPIHFEVKRTETLQLEAAIQQAVRDASGLPWCVAHKKNRGDWVAIVDMRYLVTLLKEFLPDDVEPP